MPVLTIFAGPNGSGKSTATGSWDLGPAVAILDPDAIARRKSPVDPSLAAIEAGREVLRSTDEYIREGQSFALETTLSGTWTMHAIRKAKKNSGILCSAGLRLRKKPGIEYSACTGTRRKRRSPCS